MRRFPNVDEQLTLNTTHQSYYYATFNAPCVGRKDEESQAQTYASKWSEWAYLIQSCPWVGLTQGLGRDFFCFW